MYQSNSMTQQSTTKQYVCVCLLHAKIAHIQPYDLLSLCAIRSSHLLKYCSVFKHVESTCVRPLFALCKMFDHLCVICNCNISSANIRMSFSTVADTSAPQRLILLFMSRSCIYIEMLTQTV